eukprot:12030787-Ditylum_brightwellii.AAC.1
MTTLYISCTCKKLAVETVELPGEVKSTHSGKAGKPKDDRDYNSSETSREKACVSSIVTE